MAKPELHLSGGQPRSKGLSLFWRTFFLLSALLMGSVLAWVQTLRDMDFEPHALQTAQHIASLVNLSRAAILHSEATARASLFKTMQEQEHLVIVPYVTHDTFVPIRKDGLSQRVTHELESRLGTGTLMAGSVNGVKGLWVRFRMGTSFFWLQTDRSRLDQSTGNAWMIWLLLAVTLSLAGAAWMSRLINVPLQNLSFAASRAREGDFEASTLDESVTTSEIRDVNVGFNRMTQKLAKIEQDRAVMLAGISHDLRTPLGRLRLEIELSVTDTKARNDMASDISQLDAIIDKFLDYARPGQAAKNSVSLSDNVWACVSRLNKRSDLEFTLAVPPDLWVQADSVELQRVIDNLLENAARYGKSPDTGIANIDLSAQRVGNAVLLRLRDHGIGVAATQMGQLTTPFFRGEAARTAANGTGLGLAIVDKIVSRMGGTLEFGHASKGGLCVTIWLPAA